MIVLALIRRWWHCLWSLHRAVTVYDTFLGGWSLGCECGRVFHDPGGYFRDGHL